MSWLKHVKSKMGSVFEMRMKERERGRNLREMGPMKRGRAVFAT